MPTVLGLPRPRTLPERVGLRVVHAALKGRLGARAALLSHRQRQRSGLAGAEMPTDEDGRTVTLVLMVMKIMTALH